METPKRLNGRETEAGGPSGRTWWSVQHIKNNASTTLCSTKEMQLERDADAVITRHVHTHTHLKRGRKEGSRMGAPPCEPAALGGRAAYSLTGGVSSAMMMPMMTKPATGPV